MKFSDITGQDVTTLTEAPMGFMKSLTTGAKALLNPSLSGRKQAQGQFKTGRSANQIYGEFYKWLGSTQEEQNPTTSNVIAFLQQQGYGQQAIAAAQKAFPAPADATHPAADQNQPNTPPANYGGGQTQAPAPNKVNYSGMPKPKPLPQATAATNGAYSAKTSYATQTPATARPSVSQNLDPRAAGANARARLAASRPKLKEDADTVLTKDQLSTIFTAVAQSGATPQIPASNNNLSNTGQTNSGDQNQAPSASLGNQQASTRGLPTRLTAEQILNYYANLSSPYDRDQVKKGIAEIDKQMSRQTQQARQQPAK
jgi:hypothetical protein